MECDIIRQVMRMRIMSLASSSVYGNAYLISSGSTSVLIDCGVPIRRLEKNLLSLGVDPKSLAGVFISHEHSDHIRALQLKTPFPEKYDIPVFAPQEFWSAAVGIVGLRQELRRSVEAGHSTMVGGLLVSAFGKSHDAVAPLGFRVTANDGTSAAVVTDLGEVTEDVVRGARGVDYLVFESNHDRQMELDSGRPYMLIRRVLGRFGHLSNDEAGAALSEIATERTRGIMLAHLSLDCNTPRLAIRTVASYLRRCCFSGLLTVAQAEGVSVLADIRAEELEA